MSSILLKILLLLLIVKVILFTNGYLQFVFHNNTSRKGDLNGVKANLFPDLTGTGNTKNALLLKAAKTQQMVLAMVSCGDRLNETSNVIKSAAALSINNLTIIIFTEKKNINYFSSMHINWPIYIKNRIQLIVKEAIYPANVMVKNWRPLFRKCSSLRLFMPTLLHDVDAILYVDLDILFMTGVDHYWNYFSFMNSSQMTAMAPEHTELATGWYNRFATHPYYGRLGLNSGVMLMNLTRFRIFSWEEYLQPIFIQFHKDLHWGDQDIINIIFHYHPDKVYVMGCENNFRPDFCMYINLCKEATKVGVRAVHGSRFAFTDSKLPAFKAVYEAWNKYNISEHLRQDLYYPMKRYLLKTRNTNCGKLHELFLKSLKQIADHF